VPAVEQIAGHRENVKNPRDCRTHYFQSLYSDTLTLCSSGSDFSYFVYTSMI